MKTTQPTAMKSQTTKIQKLDQSSVLCLNGRGRSRCFRRTMCMQCNATLNLVPSVMEISCLLATAPLIHSKVGMQTVPCCTDTAQNRVVFISTFNIERVMQPTYSYYK